MQSTWTRRRFVVGGCAWAGLAQMSLAAGEGVSPLLLARDFHAGVDVSRYLVSEKFDGVRAHWDGRTLRFRSGLPIAAPSWFTQRLPAVPLDGELWMGRGRFEALAGAVRKAQPVDDEWHSVQYLVFELPGAAGTFTERAARVRAITAAAKWSSLVAVEHMPVADEAALRQRLAEVVSRGGEGLVLHRADASYQTGRSDVLLKLKPLQDAEAVVLAHVPGRGRHAGRLGALRVRDDDGHTFLIGTGFTDAQRDNPPPVGAVVTYRHRGVTERGVPRFASFWRVRAEP